MVPTGSSYLYHLVPISGGLFSCYAVLTVSALLEIFSCFDLFCQGSCKRSWGNKQKFTNIGACNYRTCGTPWPHSLQVCYMHLNWSCLLSKLSLYLLANLSYALGFSRIFFGYQGQQAYSVTSRFTRRKD